MPGDLTIGFRTLDHELDDLIRLEFEQDKMQHINQFTAESLTTIILSATRESVDRLLRFFRRHRDSLAIAFVRMPNGATLSLFDHADKDLFTMAAT